MKKTIILPIVILLLFFSFSCKNSQNEENNELINKSYDIDSLNEVGTHIKEVFYSLPSPIEMATIIKQTNVEFSPSILNPSENLKNYTTMEAMAINLGIYGADLSFTSLFDKKQNSLEYFYSVKKLADNLGILEAMSDSTMQEIEANIADNDVLVKIISESFFQSDAYLKETQKENVATLIVLGAWIESLYIALELTEVSIENVDLVQRIIDQRLILENVILLLGSIEDKKVNELSSSFSDISESFNNLVIIEKKEVYDEYADTMRTKTITKYDITQEKYTDLYEKVLEVRNYYISLN